MIGAEPAEPTMVIKGSIYRVSVEAEGIILTKSTGESHVIIDGACSCSDHHYRSQADPSHRCKHVLACIDGGFLPPTTPEADTPSVDFPEATMPDDHTMALMAFGLMPISGGAPDPDTLLDDLEHSARSLRAPFPSRLEEDVALTCLEAAEEIRTLRALVARREADATTYWNSLHDLIGLAEEAVLDFKACLDPDDHDMLDVHEEQLARARRALASPAR